MKRLIHVFAFVLVATLSLSAQPMERGDVIVGLDMFCYFTCPAIGAELHVYRRDGAYKNLLYRFDNRYPRLFDILVRGNVVYAGAFPGPVETIDFNGNPLGPLRASVGFPISLSPGPNGGLLVASESGEIYQFDAGLSFVRKRRVAEFPVYNAAIDLANDRCTVYWAARHSIIRWDACLDTAPVTLEPIFPVYLGAIRVLQDQSILVSNLANSDTPVVLHLDSNGNVLREYDKFGDALALDIDGTSFWTISDDHLVRVDIATGAVLSRSGEALPNSIFWPAAMAIVGEPRAGIAPSSHTVPVPAVSRSVLAAFVLALAAIATLILRVR